jgi:predicted glycoside hydrolase/deacetylase ChbG (UPF0249 family)
MKGTRLIVNADDCGLSRGITDGVIHAHRFGFLTSTSLMAGMPASEYSVAQLQKVSTLGVGVHLNVCTGKPVLPPREIPSLVDANGLFHSPALMARKLWLWKVAACDLEAEFRAQIRWIKDRGIAPTHADSHHHMHIYPAAVRAFLRALKAEGIRQARAPVCGTFPKGGTLGGPHEGPLSRRLLVHTYRNALQCTFLRRLQMPDKRISFFSRDRKNPAVVGDSWKNAIDNLPPGAFELACHPAYFEPGFSESDPIRKQREEELDCLTNCELHEAIDRRGIRLITYNELPECAAAEADAAVAAAS